MLCREILFAEKFRDELLLLTKHLSLTTLTPLTPLTTKK